MVRKKRNQDGTKSLEKSNRDSSQPTSILKKKKKKNEERGGGSREGISLQHLFVSAAMRRSSISDNGTEKIEATALQRRIIY